MQVVSTRARAGLFLSRKSSRILSLSGIITALATPFGPDG
ncbi:4-hydroxy-tetrahydrodipicolinate synthase, partial [Xanthomonas oryzae pv. oryzae]